MISYREERLLHELGMSAVSGVIYPLIASQSLCQTRNGPAILPVGPNAFNTYSLQKSINDVIPLFAPRISQAYEIQVAGQLLGEQPPPMPHPLKYYGVVDDYAERLSRSAFMIALTSDGTGQQIKIFEALASGIPVSVYRCSLPAEVLSANPSIIGVDTLGELAEAIVQLWRDKQVLQRYWVMAAEAAERQANMRSTFPYCCSLKKAHATYNYKKAGSAGGLTVLAVAHRLSSIRKADKVEVLEQVRVVVRGSYAELMALDSLYAELWRHQISERFSPGVGL